MVSGAPDRMANRAVLEIAFFAEDDRRIVGADYCAEPERWRAGRGGRRRSGRPTAPPRRLRPTRCDPVDFVQRHGRPPSAEFRPEPSGASNHWIEQEETMSVTSLDIFDRTIQTTNIWLKEISAAIRPDRHLAWKVRVSCSTSCATGCLSKCRPGTAAAAHPRRILDQFRPADARTEPPRRRIHLRSANGCPTCGPVDPRLASSRCSACSTATSSARSPR
jgi:hypothetical protein